MKILQVGQDPACSIGGIVSVIETIRNDEQLNKDFHIDVYGSCVQGNIVKRLTFTAYAYLRFCLTKRGYDVYHLHMAARGSTFRKGHYLRHIKKWGKRAVIQIHSGDYIDFYNGLSESKKKRLVEILKAADVVVALSDGWKEKFESTFGLNNCITIENAVNTDLLRGGCHDIKTYQHSFASLSRLSAKKGTFDLICAVEVAKNNIPDIIVYLAGDGDVAKAKQLIRDKHLEENVKLLGWIDTAKKVELFSEVSTVILPSYHEGLPMAVLEGMACGKAIVSTTVGAIPEIVGTENGILIQPGDVQALADALVECATNTERIKKMSLCNMKKIEQQYSICNMQQKLSTCYRSLQ